ncbi:hypothetical protein [Chitinophaga sp. RAB17]|uniref:hypothetical protein n=1 Tax=Chitinophaga sp. RAB17 TaxID=3233049 RepID=UPI003F8DA4A5
MKKVLFLFAVLTAIVSLAYSQQREVTVTRDGNLTRFAAIGVKGIHTGTTVLPSRVYPLSVSDIF